LFIILLSLNLNINFLGFLTTPLQVLPISDSDNPVSVDATFIDSYSFMKLLFKSYCNMILEFLCNTLECNAKQYGQ
jgi:hypothetical protein